MAVFRRSRKTQQSVLPDEVNQYYQSQRRERTGVALLLGIVALVVTLLIGAALFFGGRYIYRQFVDNDNDQAQTAQQEGEGEGQEQKPAESQPNEGQGQSTSDTTTPGSSSADQGEAAETPAPAPARAPSPAPTPSTPSTGDDTLPHTGDPGM